MPADVVLLDIQMPECDGFAVIEAVGPARMPAVIFITAFDDHAVRAFDVRALDYLLKPFTPARVERALDLAREQMHARRVSAAVADLAGIVGTPREGGQPDRLMLRQRGKVTFVPAAEVEVVVAKRNDVVVTTRSAQYRCRATLAEMHERLGPAFVRVHRSTLVNLHAVKPALISSGGVRRLQLSGGGDVRVSKAFRADVERRLSRGEPS
jgi:two-component system LytT family response regulator